jgi:hypothetical protein
MCVIWGSFNSATQSMKMPTQNMRGGQKFLPKVRTNCKPTAYFTSSTMMMMKPGQSLDLPPTIDSCGGSLHSESHHDTTEGDLFNEDERAEKGANDPISKRDRDFDKKWRGLVSFLLLGNALIITGATYAFLTSSEQSTFEASVSFLQEKDFVCSPKAE